MIFGFKTNSAMAALLPDLNIGKRSLRPELQALAETEFDRDGSAVLLRRLAPKRTNVTAADFMDDIAREAFFNEIHIDNEDSDDPLADGVRFAQTVLTRWNNSDAEEAMTAILSYQEEVGVTLKFHLSRSGVSLLADDLETYEEPVLVMQSNSLADAIRSTC
ncbi:MAG: hypothetical protein AAFY15_00370 [Cyanobacteria bacterium J06648_11]